MSSSYNAVAVKQGVDIFNVIVEYVRLRRIGTTGRYLGLCPFHQEKTASFNVNQTEQFYKCFGCGVGGDVIDFTMRAETLQFPQAVNLLGERHGIEPEKPWTPEERRAYAKASVDAQGLAQRLSDFANGLQITVERQLKKLSESLIELGADPSESLAHLHRGAYLLRKATPRDIAATWRTMRLQDQAAVDQMERIGREDREYSNAVTKSIVELLAASVGDRA